MALNQSLTRGMEIGFPNRSPAQSEMHKSHARGRTLSVMEWVLMRISIVKLVVLQFALFSVACILAFIAWAITLMDGTHLLRMIVGEYISGHIVRWTIQLPLWGPLLLVSSALSIMTVWYLQSARREGGYLGIISFVIAFVTNLLFARNLLVHWAIGCSIGWTLIAPLVIGWSDLDGAKALE